MESRNFFNRSGYSASEMEAAFRALAKSFEAVTLTFKSLAIKNNFKKVKSKYHS